MKVVLSRRVEAELVEYFEYGQAHFGRKIAERTFARVRRSIFDFLAAHPRMAI
jgi:plasmid stabilization system protein ParE